MLDRLRETAKSQCILEIRSGSNLYGTNTPESDEDFVGIFVPPIEYLLGLHNVQEVSFNLISKDKENKNTKEAVDKKLYELRKFANLALQNNPNILEILFVNQKNIIQLEEPGQILLEIRDSFTSMLCVPRFIGYAHAQKHKMIIKKEHFQNLLDGYDFLEMFDSKYTMSQVYDYTLADKNPFFKKEKGMHIHIGDICFEPAIYVKKAKKLLKTRIDKFTNRSELILKYGFDTKFASHLIRLLHEAKDLLTEHEIVFPLKNASHILDIKNGNYTIKEIIQEADDLEAELDSLKETSTLQKKPDFNKVENIVIEIMKEYLNL